MLSQIIADSQQARSFGRCGSQAPDIVKLETNIRELRDMFVDMALLVEAQVTAYFSFVPTEPLWPNYRKLRYKAGNNVTLGVIVDIVFRTGR